MTLDRIDGGSGNMRAAFGSIWEERAEARLVADLMDILLTSGAQLPPKAFPVAWHVRRSGEYLSGQKRQLSAIKHRLSWRPQRISD
jgi:hypothetical protein